MVSDDGAAHQIPSPSLASRTSSSSALALCGCIRVVWVATCVGCGRGLWMGSLRVRAWHWRAGRDLGHRTFPYNRNILVRGRNNARPHRDGREGEASGAISHATNCLAGAGWARLHVKPSRPHPAQSDARQVTQLGHSYLDNTVQREGRGVLGATVHRAPSARVSSGSTVRRALPCGTGKRCTLLQTACA